MDKNFCSPFLGNEKSEGGFTFGKARDHGAFYMNWGAYS